MKSAVTGEVWVLCNPHVSWAKDNLNTIKPDKSNVGACETSERGGAILDVSTPQQVKAVPQLDGTAQ